MKYNSHKYCIFTCCHESYNNVVEWVSILFSRLQENVTTIFCNCNPDPDIDFIYSSVRRLLLFFIYFHQSAGVQKTKSGCLPKIFEPCPLAWLAMYPCHPLSSSVNIQILRTVLKRIRQENLFKDQLQSISVNWSFLTPYRSLGANAISLYIIFAKWLKPRLDLPMNTVLQQSY